MIRTIFTNVTRKVLLRIGVSPKNVQVYRDGVLGLAVLIPAIVASRPLFLAFSGDVVTANDTFTGLVWLAVAFTISLLSPKWNLVLAAAWAFLTFRGVIAIVVTGGDVRVLALTVVFLALTIGCTLINPHEGATRK